MIKIILLILLVILIIFFTYRNIENFQAVEMISDFYTGNTSINLKDKFVNARRICIFKKGKDPENPLKFKITDYECINAEQLFTSMNLSSSKKKLVCLDENCLNISDLKLMNGKEAFKLGNSPTMIPKYSGKCFGGQYFIKLKKCGSNTKVSENPQFRDTHWDKTFIRSFGPTDCNSSAAWSLRILEGNNSDKDLIRNEINKSNVGLDSSNPKIFVPEGH